MIKETSLIIISKAPRKCELVERLRKIDVIMYNICRKSKAFDSDQFKNEVQSFLKFYDEYTSILLNEKEKENLKVLILSTNENLSKTNYDDKIQEKLIEITIKEFGNYSLDYLSKNYIKAMNEIDSKYNSIISSQSQYKHIQKLELKTPKQLIINEEYTFQINEIISIDQNISNFIEFYPSNNPQPLSVPLNSQNANIVIQSRSISIYPHSTPGEYKYPISLSILDLQSLTINTLSGSLTIFINSPPTTQSPLSILPILLTIILIFLLLCVLLFLKRLISSKTSKLISVPEEPSSIDPIDL